MAEVKKEGKKKMTKTELEQALIDNFVSLQKVLSNLAVKFDFLSDNISKLLNIFEISAKSFAEKNSKSESEINKDVAQKIDILLEQNKILAKGLTLIEENTRERQSPFSQPAQSQFRPLPQY